MYITVFLYIQSIICDDNEEYIYKYKLLFKNTILFLKSLEGVHEFILKIYLELDFGMFEGPF